MKIVAKVDFISVDFGNVKKDQEIKGASKSQAEQLQRLDLIYPVQQETSKKKAK